MDEVLPPEETDSWGLTKKEKEEICDPAVPLQREPSHTQRDDDVIVVDSEEDCQLAP